MVDEDLTASQMWKQIKNFAVADFGFKTLDYTVFNGKDIIGLGERLSNSADGINTLFIELKTRLNRAYPRINITHHMLEDVIKTGVLKTRGGVEDVSDVVIAAREAYVDRAFGALYNAWEPVLDQLDAVFIEGGAARFLERSLFERFKTVGFAVDKLMIADDSEDPQMQNVRGYRKLARLLWTIG